MPQSRPGGAPTIRRAPTESVARIAPRGPRGSFAGTLTWRSLVLFGVIVLAIAVVLPSLRVYMQQQEQLAVLRAEAERARVEVNDLEAQVERWNDPAFVMAQARERLGFVFPGERPYRVIDPEFVTSHAEGSPAAAASPEALATAVWYVVVWDSIEQAGNGDAGEILDEPAVHDPEDEPAPITDVDFGG